MGPCFRRDDTELGGCLVVSIPGRRQASRPGDMTAPRNRAILVTRGARSGTNLGDF
jgi:hypothetical protein